MQVRTLPDFQYCAPQTIHEACSLLEEHKGQVTALAGGTDLLVKMKYRIVAPKILVGLKNLPGLADMLFSEADGLHLGTLVTHESIAGSPLIRDRFGALASACSEIGTPQIRNMGTIGGNVCNASPAADSVNPLIALGAAVKLVSVAGERIVPLEKYFTGPGTTVRQAGEILSEIHVPCPPSHSGSAYVKLPARTAVDIAAVGVAVAVTLDPESRVCQDVKIVLGAVAPTSIRARKSEEILRGEIVGHSLIEKAAQRASEEASPVSDVRSSARYRTAMVKVLAKLAINQALKRMRTA